MNSVRYGATSNAQISAPSTINRLKAANHAMLQILKSVFRSESRGGRTDQTNSFASFCLQSSMAWDLVQMGRRARGQHCTSPGATTGNNRKHAKRPRAGKGAGSYGEEFMLYCIFDERTKKYERCEPTTKGRGQDSRMQRFDREIGFETPAAAVASGCQGPVTKSARDAQRNVVASVHTGFQ